MSSIPTLTVSLIDSDYADFSLPSYEAVSSAEINTNLKGSKQIFSDGRFELTSDSSAGGSPANAAAGKSISAADLLSDKAAAKIADMRSMDANFFVEQCQTRNVHFFFFVCRYRLVVLGSITTTTTFQ